MTYFGYMGLSIGFNVLIYPFTAHWGFDPNGWLVDMGYKDFAGSGTVHAVGGIGALMTTLYLRPRTNRFNPRMAHSFEPNNPTFIALGTFIVYYQS
jgi:ammonium transporter, Amt family